MTQDKVLTRFEYKKGPMYFLGQKIVQQMQKAGYPSKIVYCYRSPEKQEHLYASGRTRPGRKVTNARAYQSAHQYSEAVDICHKHKGWDVSEAYWDQLAIAVRIVEEKYGVPLNHGHNWRFRDSAHIEVMAWKEVRAQIGHREPTPSELDARFQDLLPKEWRAYTKSRAYERHRTERA